MSGLYQEQEACIRDLHAVDDAMRDLKVRESELAAEKVRLVLTLTGRFWWSQVDVADELGITQQRVCRLLRRKRVSTT